MRAVAPVLLLAFAPLAMPGCKQEPDKNTDNGGTEPTSDTEEVAHDIGAWLSMKALPDGTIGLAYYDRTVDALGFAVGTLVEGGIDWAREEVDSFPADNGLNPGDAGKYASLAVAADGTAWIGYQDTSNGTLKFAKRDAATKAWTVGIADIGGGGRSDAGYWASVALAPGDAPVIAHYDQGEGELRVARWNGTAFVGAIAAEGEDYVPTDTAETQADANVGEYAKLLIGADGKEYLAFYDRAFGALKLASGTAGAYTVETVDDSANVGTWPDLALEGEMLHIAYQDVTNQDLKLASGTPGAFSVQTIDSGDYRGADAAIFVDNGAVGAFYFDGVNNDLLKGTLSGGSWSGGKAGGDGAAIGYHNETVSVGGTRYVASYDYTNRTIWFAASN